MFMSMFADAQCLTSQELQLSCGLVKKDAEKVAGNHGSHGIENGGLGQQKHVELNNNMGMAVLITLW